MSNEDTQSPVPYNLVEHVHRSKSGKTVMAISLPIELRARMHKAALDLGCSKLALARTAIAQFLVHHEASRRSGQERAYQATVPVPPVGASSPVPDPEPLPNKLGARTSEPTVAEPEHLPVPEPEPELEPEPAPVTIPLRKRTSKKS